ncbi:MAG: AraC family transcriptional regulator [Clostridiales bacterium]|nr:AraC family transcriptional regulator [Clostridiales bacterium]
MKWINRLNDCITYIEENIRETIDMDILCTISCLSRLYFYRMFEAASGISLANYIKSRKMTLAVSDLQIGKKVIDVAIDYGYSSSESFSRAFKDFHGISPSYVKNSDHEFISYAKLLFQIKIIGDAKMNYKIVEKDEFKLMGHSIITTIDDQKNYKELPEFWDKLYKNKTIDTMCKMSGQKDEGGRKYGICYPCKEGESTFEYAIAVDYNSNNDGLKVFTFPKSKWAIFECIGPMPVAIQKLWDEISASWLPSNDYEINRAVPDIEYYTEGYVNNVMDYKSEIWLPIK